ncbi:MAG: SGNH/GDSL hydrolase family protein [Clostridia bacterium]|nr:SGNH/GDSL hydrolase family protein [Clostridia bacterium]
MKDFKNKTLLVFGDSIMYGSGNGGVGVGEYLEYNYGFTLKKYCVGGARVGYDDGKSWIVEQVRQAVSNGEKPDLIVFNGFTNDCNMTDGKNCDVQFGSLSDSAPTDIFNVEKTNANFTDCFKSICEAFKKYFPQSKVLFVRPHKMGRRGADVQIKYGECAVRICKEYGFSVADIYADGKLDTFDEAMRDEYTFDSYNWGRGDCTHPNAAGYLKFYMPLIGNAVISLFKGEEK